MLSVFIPKSRFFSTSIKTHVAGDIYRQLWKSATGGLTYSKRHRKKKSFTPIETQHIQFGREKVKWMGLNQTIPSTNSNINYENMITKEKRQPLKTINDVDTFLAPHNLTLNIGGYSNTSMTGRYVGYPVEMNHDDEFRNYESSVIMLKKQRIMKTNHKKMMFRAVVLIGDKKGTLGYGDEVADRLMEAVELARNRAIQNLYHIPIYDGHTIIHSIAAKYNNTYVALDPRPRGYGIIAQRTISDICKLVGIQNLYAKIDGNSRNPVSIMKAFLRATYSQETHQELAERTGCIVAVTDIPNSSNLNYGIDNGFIKVLALPSSNDMVIAERRRMINMDDEFFNQLSNYRGLHEPKDMGTFFEDHLRKPRPIKENKVLKRIIDEGD